MGRHAGPASTAARFRKKIAGTMGVTYSRVPDWAVRHRVPTRPLHIRVAVPGGKIKSRGEPIGELLKRFRGSRKTRTPKGVTIVGRSPIKKHTKWFAGKKGI